VPLLPLDLEGRLIKVCRGHFVSSVFE
jgi:hypothetical protein